MREPSSASKLNLSLDYRLLTALLVVVVAAMLVMWHPWSAKTVSDRTVQVTGQATISARPDEFVFYPTYDFKNDDREAALSALTVKNNEVIAKTKQLGVADSKIKSNSDNWSYPIYYNDIGTATYTLRLTITVDSEKIAQKVQDYLLTTGPTGTISPTATFSKDKQKQLEDQARDKASQDARLKAEKSAQNLGFHLGGVKKVDDGAGFGGGVYPLLDKAMATDSSAGRPSLTIQPGENDLTYTVTVTYYIK